MEAQIGLMTPTRERHATLVDLLDRVLEKGLVLNADIIISVAGIPLIGVNLRAALAGMETMLKYGMMRDWDERTREWERKHVKHVQRREPFLPAGEEVLVRMYGAHWYSRGIYRAWRSGNLYLTGKRLLLHRSEPAETLLETSLEDLRGLAIKRETHFTGIERNMIYLVRHGDEPAYLYAEKPWALKRAIEERMQALGLGLEKGLPIPVLDKEVGEYLGDGERITAEAKMWYKAPPAGIIGETWRAGRLYLSSKRLLWWCNEDRKALFDVPLSQITGARAETRDLGGIIRERQVLIVSRSNGRVPLEALFAGDEVGEWARALASIVGQMETCPGCGRPAPARELLDKGCLYCGWVSPRPRKHDLDIEPIGAQ